MRLFHFPLMTWGLIIGLIVIAVVLLAVFYNKKYSKTFNNTNKQTGPRINHSVSSFSNQNTSNVSICPNCKTPVGNGISFCMMCGTKIK